MILDCRTWKDLPDHGESQRRRVFVDGVEQRQVWYVDTDAQLVKTFDVYGDGHAYATATGFRGDRTNPDVRAAELLSDDPDVEDRDGILSRTVRGRVELRPLS